MTYSRKQVNTLELRGGGAKWKSLGSLKLETSDCESCFGNLLAEHTVIFMTPQNTSVFQVMLIFKTVAND